MPVVALSRFFNNTKMSVYGYSPIYDEKLLTAVQYKLEGGEYQSGYRDGVVLVPITHANLGDADYPIRSRVVKVDKDTEFVTFCDSRVEGEKPRIKIRALVDSLPPANYIVAVVYRSDVLAEDNDRSSDANWEIVALLAQRDEYEPIHHATLMANHFKADGGTDTLMSPEEFEQALRQSYNYWKDRAIATTRNEYESGMHD